jgi:hypothetical protein
MRTRSSALLAAGLVLLLAACGASGGGAGAAATAGAQATPPPQATPTEGGGTSGGETTGGDTGGKPAGWDQYGKVHIEMSGPVSKTVDLGFVPAGSVFGGAEGSSFSFQDLAAGQIASILIGPDNSVVISYGDEEFSMPGAQCTTSNWNIGATSASGTFDCTAAFVVLASGGSLASGKLKGSFTAHN